MSDSISGVTLPVSTVTRQEGCLDFDVDAVLPWVDGDDPAHERKRLSFLGSRGPSKSAHSTRYADRGELEYCVSSILRFAPWVRRVFIVTDSQLPHWYESLPREYRERIKIVDHKEIFRGYEGLLPTFNSLSIETMIWRIPGLAEHFIYLNDDLSLLAPLSKGDFFTSDGVLLRGAWEQRARGYFLAKNLKRLFRKGRVTHRFSQLKGAALGAPRLDRTFVTGHIPQPMRKSTFDEFFRAYPDLLARNARFRFRSWSQFWPISLAHHLEIDKGSATFVADDESLYLSPRKMDSEKMQASLEACRCSSIKFLCVQSLDQASDEFYQFWISWMSQHVGCLDDRINGP